jgi:hypothetical protein
MAERGPSSKGQCSSSLVSFRLTPAAGREAPAAIGSSTVNRLMGVGTEASAHNDR